MQDQPPRPHHPLMWDYFEEQASVYIISTKKDHRKTRLTVSLTWPCLYER